MSEEEYEDFVLRYKGCGACFPMYHTLSRFEKMWFSAIQKDVADLEKENAELKEALKNDKVCKCSHYFNFKDLEKQLTKAKEIIKDFLLMAKVEHLKDRYETVDEAEQFLNSEVEK